MNVCLQATKAMQQSHLPFTENTFASYVSAWFGVNFETGL